jgi:WD40 repeat protein
MNLIPGMVGALLTLALLALYVSPLEAARDSPNISWIHLTTEAAVGLDWSPTGDELVTGLRDTSEIVLLNWQAGEITRRFTFPDETLPYTFSAEWSPDGQLVATLDRTGMLYILDLETELMMGLHEAAHPDSVYVDIDWSPDSTSVAALTNL